VDKEAAMKAVSALILVMSVLLLSSGVAPAADEEKLKDATRQVESGAKTTGEGIADTAKGVGHTVAEGARVAGDRLKDAGQAAQPDARSAWEHVKDGAWSFGQSVKKFFTRLGDRQ
jgi:hypothetical protein